MKMESLQNGSQTFMLNEITCPKLYSMSIMSDNTDWKSELLSRIPDRSLLVIPVVDNNYIVAALVDPDKDLKNLKMVFEEVSRTFGKEKAVEPFSNAMLYDPEAEAFIGLKNEGNNVSMTNITY